MRLVVDDGGFTGGRTPDETFCSESSAGDAGAGFFPIAPPRRTTLVAIACGKVVDDRAERYSRGRSNCGAGALGGIGQLHTWGASTGGNAGSGVLLMETDLAGMAIAILSVGQSDQFAQRGV